jgi:hypothetical protein
MLVGALVRSATTTTMLIATLIATRRESKNGHTSLSLIQNDITMQLRIMSTILAFSTTEQSHHSVPINICTI